jgi:hypothetical protein
MFFLTGQGCTMGDPQARRARASSAAKGCSGIPSPSVLEHGDPPQDGSGPRARVQRYCPLQLVQGRVLSRAVEVALSAA